MHRTEQHAACRREIEEATGRSERRRQRLFHEDVMPGLDSLTRERFVSGRGRAEMNDRRLATGQRGAQLISRHRVRISCGQRLGTRQVPIDHGRDPAAGTYCGIRVPAAHQSGANDHH